MMKIDVLYVHNKIQFTSALQQNMSAKNTPCHRHQLMSALYNIVHDNQSKESHLLNYLLADLLVQCSGFLEVEKRRKSNEKKTNFFLFFIKRYNVTRTKII